MMYLVTGATGFVGGEITRQLIKAGHDVRAVVRDPQKAKWMDELGVKFYKGDVTDKESIREAMTGVDGVFHMAGWYKLGIKDKGEGERVNVQGTRNALELMQELKIPKGIYTSTCGVNSDTKGIVVDESYHFSGKHISEYDRTKAVAHDLANTFIAGGLPLVIVMPDVIYGPGDTSTLRTSIIQFLNGYLPALPSQTGICMGHVDDTVQGHILAMEKGRIGETYIIAGDPLQMTDIFKLAAQITGKRAPITFPYQLMKIMATLIAPFDALLPEGSKSENLRVLAGVTYWGDNSKAKRELGFSTRPFREGWEAILRHEMKLLGIKQ